MCFFPEETVLNAMKARRTATLIAGDRVKVVNHCTDPVADVAQRSLIRRRDSDQRFGRVPDQGTDEREFRFATHGNIEKQAGQADEPVAGPPLNRDLSRCPNRRRPVGEAQGC